MPKLLQLLLLLLPFPSIHSSLCLSQSSALCRSQLKNQSPFNDNNNRCNMLWYFCAFAASLHCKYVNRVRGQAGRQSPRAPQREIDRQLKYEYTHIFTFISLLQLQSAATTASCCGCATVVREEEVGGGEGNRIKSQQNY